MDDLEELLSKSKDDYMDAISSFDKNKNKDNLILCMRKGTKYFNKAEKAVSQSKIDGKHNDGLWVTDLAESCEAILGSYLKHIMFLEFHNDLIDGAYRKPTDHACSNMQRMVKKYSAKNVSDKLRADFLAAELPTKGFDVEEAEDKNKMDVYLPVGVGIFLIIITLIMAMIIKNPSPTQFFIIRGVFALSCAAVGSCIPGWLKVNINGYVKAGGAIALILIFWFFNPPAILMS